MAASILRSVFGHNKKVSSMLVPLNLAEGYIRGRKSLNTQRQYRGVWNLYSSYFESINEQGFLKVDFPLGVKEAEANLYVEYLCQRKGQKSRKDGSEIMALVTVAHHVTILKAIYDHFIRNDGATNKKIPEATARRLFKKMCCDIGLDKNISPHSCRATAITKLLSDKNDYRTVQEFSRHSSARMVEKYDKRIFGIDENPGRKLTF